MFKLRIPSRKSILIAAALLLVAGGALVVGGGSAGGSFSSFAGGAFDGMMGLFVENRSPSEPVASRVERPRREAEAEQSAGDAEDAEASEAEPAPADAGVSLTVAGAALTGQLASDLAAAASVSSMEGQDGSDPAGSAEENPLRRTHEPPEAEVTIAEDPGMAPEETDIVIEQPGEDPGAGSWDGDDPFQFEDEGDGSLRHGAPTYSNLGRRDPFFALVTAREQNAQTSSMVDPEFLRMVGVVWGDRGIAALVEDGQRRGYVLREGDRVLYGRVVSISRDTMVMHQVIHGEFKKVTLHLDINREEN